MRRIIAISAFALALCGPAQAQQSDVFVEYSETLVTGGAQGEWQITVTILENGSLTVRRCEGETSGCKTRRAKVSEDALEAIRAAVTASELVERPAAENLDTADGDPGGGSGTVFLDGVEIELLSFPAFADFDRVELVREAIRDAVPAKLQPLLES